MHGHMRDAMENNCNMTGCYRELQEGCNGGYEKQPSQHQSMYLRRHSCISRRTAVLLNSGGRRRLSRGGHAETFQTGSGCTVTDTAGATLGRMVRAPTANNPCRCGDLITVDLVGLVQADFIRLSRRP